MCIRDSYGRARVLQARGEVARAEEEVRQGLERLQHLPAQRRYAVRGRLLLYRGYLRSLEMCIRDRIATAPRSTAETPARLPWKPPMGVRAPATMTISDMERYLLFWIGSERFSGRILSCDREAPKGHGANHSFD